MKKTPLLLFVVLLVWGAVQCKWIGNEGPSKFPPYKTFEMTGPNGPVEVRSPYVPNEIIVSYPQPANANRASDAAYLSSKGFVKVDACDCGGNLELWRRGPVGEAQDVDLIGVIKDPPPPPNPRGVGEGLFLNFAVDDRGELKPTIQSYNDNFTIDTTVQGSAPTRSAAQQSILVGVVDGGVNTTHPLLRPYLWGSARDACNTAVFGLNTLQFGTDPVDESGHGSMVNGILAGVSQPAEASFGTHIDVLNVKFSKNESGTLFDAVCGLYYAINHGAKVINASWGFYEDTTRMDSSFLVPVLDLAKSEGVVLVAGLGNNGVSLDGSTKFWPACFSTRYETVIGVGALDITGNLSTFSNWSTNPNIFNMGALGEQILSTYLINTGFPNGIARASGTSFATPFVARTVAIRLSRGASSTGVRNALRSTSVFSFATRGEQNITVPKLVHSEAVQTPD